MRVTVHERFRLRPGMRVRLLEGWATVRRVTASAAVCTLPVVRTVRLRGRLVTFRSERIVRISANSDVTID